VKLVFLKKKLPVFKWFLIFTLRPPMTCRILNISYLLCVKSECVCYIFTYIFSSYQYFLMSNLSIYYKSLNLIYFSVNSVSGCSRTLEQVKKKWIDLKVCILMLKFLLNLFNTSTRRWGKVLTVSRYFKFLHSLQTQMEFYLRVIHMIDYLFSHKPRRKPFSTLQKPGKQVVAQPPY
jgi:hypothetical protein